MAQYPYDLVEAFAAAPLQGNLLPVIHDADGISTETMQVIANRFRLSETSFLQTAPESHQTYRHRIFLVTREIPFAGHPSIGSAASWTKRQGLASAEIIQLTGYGEQRLHVEMHGSSATVDLWQGAANFGAHFESAPILAAIGLNADTAHPTLRPQVVSTGFPTSIVPIADYRQMANPTIDWRALDAALPRDANGDPKNFYLVGEVEPGHWRARLFGEDIAGGEDPATGSAVGPFGAYLDEYTGLKSLVVDQGVEMGSPSRLLVRTDDGVVVSGEVQFLAEGTITLD
ncbi:PhzF family phenazine biosynthesis protein [soil metagenome]